MTFTYTHTRRASYFGYITQAIINNLAPLLFVTFQQQFSVSLAQITFLVSLNFILQMVVDVFATLFVDKIGWRISVVGAHLFASAGLLGMGVFPFLFSTPYHGLLLAIVLNSLGGGLIEVLISPIVEAIPGEQKSSQMALLHSFYCWGHVAVVLLSTLYFATAGIAQWRYLPMLWALIPFINMLLFTKVPLAPLVQEHETSIGLKKLFSHRLFWLIIVMMISSGAAEQAMVQWSSFFAESGLGVSKTTGDLLGTLSFAVLMGLSRLLYGLYGEKIHLERALLGSTLLCVVSYLVTVFSPFPLLSLIACGITGFSVGLMWPGVTSIASKHFRRGGTAVFAILALAGDVGCAAGPAVVGITSARVIGGALPVFQRIFPSADLTVTGLKTGLLFATSFAIVLFLSLVRILRTQPKKAQKKVAVSPTGE